MKKNKRNPNEKKYGYEHKHFFWSLNTGSTLRYSNENKKFENTHNNESQ